MGGVINGTNNGNGHVNLTAQIVAYVAGAVIVALLIWVGKTTQDNTMVLAADAPILSQMQQRMADLEGEVRADQRDNSIAVEALRQQVGTLEAKLPPAQVDKLK